MSFVFPACVRQYITDQKIPGWNLNAIPVKNYTHPGQKNAYRIYFPRPWVLVGTVLSLDNVPTAAPPQYASSHVRLQTPVKQGAYSELSQSIFIDLAFANTHEYDEDYVSNYVGPGIQNSDYRGYFSKYLNDASIETREQYYNSIIQPASIMKQFFDANVGATPAAWLPGFYNSISFLRENIDKTLMGAPGIYSIGKEGGYGQPDWSAVSEYEQFENL